MKNQLLIFLVDDDPVFLKLLEIEFSELPNCEVETYVTGEECVENLTHKPDVIVLDYQLDGVERDVMNGLETLDKIKAYNPEIPVIMLSAQDKIDVAVNCMHHAAFDYVVKSETAFFRLKKIISTISETQHLKKQLDWYMEKV